MSSHDACQAAQGISRLLGGPQLVLSVDQPDMRVLGMQSGTRPLPPVCIADDGLCSTGVGLCWLVQHW